jgi:hypothetical protein
MSNSKYLIGLASQYPAIAKFRDVKSLWGRPERAKSTGWVFLLFAP